jgi:hypothetical protein
MSGKPIEERDLRVELKRYLGGVPFSHIRQVTREERKAIWKEILPYGLLALIFLTGIVWILVLAVRDPVIASFAGILALVPAYCLYWAWPHLRTLRSGEVFVYIGQMQNVAAFDVAQEHYQRNYEMRQHLNRYIEILATGKGDRIWRLEGLPNNGSLRGVGAIQLALIPDHDEQGVRLLTAEEREELRLRARGFLRVQGFLTKNLVALWGVLTLVRVVGQLVPELSRGWFLSIMVAVIASVIVWSPYLKRWKFARMLKHDARAGTVEDGTLYSGLPWVVRGEPARWRLGAASGGTSGVTKEEALAFEDEYYEDDLEEEEELARQAIEAGPEGLEDRNEGRVRG